MIKKNITVEKKQPTVKNNLITTLQGEVIYLSPTYAGSVHDKKICDEEKFRLNGHCDLYVDLGYIGLTSDVAQIFIPHKRKKKQELNEEEKAYNKLVSKIRVKVEHVIASIKIFRKVKEKFRGRLFAREDNVMLVACALQNLKLKNKKK